jgi:hypothetical protein
LSRSSRAFSIQVFEIFVTAQSGKLTFGTRGRSRSASGGRCRS